MKHKVGDKVRIKPKYWYEQNKNDKYGNVDVGCIPFVQGMANYCGKEATIVSSQGGIYILDIDEGFYDWTEEMFEDETKDYVVKLKTKRNEKATNF